MVTGRPHQLTDEMLAKAKEYLPLCESTPLVKTVFTKIGPQQLEIKRPPTLTGLANYLGISRDTVHRWIKENEGFSDICMRIRQEYETALIENGLTDNYNAHLSKFLLSADHDKRDKADLTTAGKELPTPLLPADVRSNDSDKENSPPQEAD